METFNISSNYHIETWQSLKQRGFYKSLVPFVKKPAFLAVCKIKPLRESIFLCQGKTNFNLVIKFVERSNRLISLYLMIYLA